MLGNIIDCFLFNEICYFLAETFDHKYNLSPDGVGANDDISTDWVKFKLLYFLDLPGKDGKQQDSNKD